MTGTIRVVNLLHITACPVSGMSS